MCVCDGGGGGAPHLVPGYLQQRWSGHVHGMTADSLVCCSNIFSTTKQRVHISIDHVSFPIDIIILGKTTKKNINNRYLVCNAAMGK